MQINMRGSGGGQTTKIDIDNLPVDHEDKGERGTGVFLLVFSLFWGGLPTIGLIAAIVTGNFEPGLLFLLLFTTIGAALFFFGLKLFFSKKKIHIDKEGVTVQQKGMTGWTSWTEPFDRYRGVLSRSEYHSGGKNSPSYTLYIVELVHDEKDKVLRLYTSRSEEGHRKVWEDYCRKLNMPAVEKDGDGYIERGVEDLDKTAAELVREGKVDLDFDITRNIPSELQVVPDGEELAVTVVKKKSSIIGIIVALAIPSVFVYVGFFIDHAPIMFGVMGILFLIIILCGIIWTKVAKQRIQMSVSGVHVFWAHPWGETAGKRMRSEEIETVRVWKKDGTQHEAVWITGDNASLSLGEGLKREPLEWLRNCILKVLSS